MHFAKAVVNISNNRLIESDVTELYLTAMEKYYDLYRRVSMVLVPLVGKVGVERAPCGMIPVGDTLPSPALIKSYLAMAKIVKIMNPNFTFEKDIIWNEECNEFRLNPKHPHLHILAFGKSSK